MAARAGRDLFYHLLPPCRRSGVYWLGHLEGNLRMFLLAAGMGGLGCIFLYFIWVGRNWPRWIIAPFFALAGFASLIWGIRDGDGPLLLAGIGGLIFFSYLALAPSVYLFARHQRERIKLGESLVVALVFLLLLASVGSGVYAFYSHVVGVERAAVSFAATTFNKVFVYHDEAFLQSNLKDEERAITPQHFIGRLANELGQPLDAGELQSKFTTRLIARQLWVEGKFQIPVTYDSHGPVWVNIQVSRIGDGWQIDHIGWRYKPHQL
ncbi:MAG: hypothetical protein H0W43_08155 [Chthoniobacterales bacterium]|nr:hypothetical protein [Chthoniobacterales bacterium]